MEFKKGDNFYHFTSFESAKLIIQNNTLKYSELQRMNDIHESYRPIFTNANLLELNEKFLKYRQISLTEDSEKSFGFAISPMWGHYAEKGKGVCFVFDKTKLLSLLDFDEKHQSISYKDEYAGGVLCDQMDIDYFFDQNIEDIFFQKNAQWSYEQEYRILRFCPNLENEEFLHFQDALVAIIMCYASDVGAGDSVFNSQNYNDLKTISRVPIYEIGYFINEIDLRDKDGNDVLNRFDGFEIDV